MKKILFVCRANVGRSQMAASFYNEMTGTHDAESAGTEIEMPGETLGDRIMRRGGTHVLEAMSEEGIDISKNRKTQLTKAMLDDYNVIINMADREYTPDWLLEHSEYVYWSVADPGGKDLQATRIARDKIKKCVEELIG